jgi:hypothetical protein
LSKLRAPARGIRRPQLAAGCTLFVSLDAIFPVLLEALSSTSHSGCAVIASGLGIAAVESGIAMADDTGPREGVQPAVSPSLSRAIHHAPTSARVRCRLLVADL